MTKLTNIILLATLGFFLATPITFAQSVLTIGDSLTAGLSVTSVMSGRVITCAALNNIVIAADNQRSCKGGGQNGKGGFQPRLAVLLGDNVFNYGNSGETTAEMVARLGSHLTAVQTTHVFILGGTNDVIQNVPTGSIISNLVAMIALVKNAGRTPVVGTIPPLLGSGFTLRSAALDQLNAEIRQLDDVLIADHYVALVDNWSSNTSGDFIHLGPLGNSIVAQIWVDALAPVDNNANNLVPVVNLLLE